ncbi:MAG: efflux RND transporter permease subunit [Candidatus Theseobacter exili]|nr:efflux RND transporter permease subunit [Candidatus Theseobacter exili]
MKITEIALRHKITVFFGLFILIIIGINSYLTLPRENAPDIPIPIFIITTVYPGVAPQDMERLVTVPLEKKLQELSGVEEMNSTTGEGVSIIRIEFTVDFNLDQAFQKVREKVDLAKPDLPDDVEEPVLTEVNVSEFPIAIVTLTGDVSVAKLEDIAEDLEDKFELVNGVIEADIAGSLEREIQILIDPDRLAIYDLSMNDVIWAIQAENVTIPGGTVDVTTKKFTVRIPGEFENPEEIKDIVVKSRGEKPVFVRDIAVVQDYFKDRTTYARFQGKPCVTITVRKRAGENAIRIIDEIKQILVLERSKLPGNIHLTMTFDESKDIRSMIEELESSVLNGVVLIIAVLMFFMGFRSSLFVALSIPFSMLLTILVVQLCGFTLNMMVLFSLILAVGMLVDNAIVIVENIYRHRQEGVGRDRAAFLGTEEVGWPVIASTATTVAAFFPLIFWPDIIGKFMSYLPKTVIVVLLSSMFIAFVVNPVFCSLFMGVKKSKKGELEDHRNKPIIRFYSAVLTKALKHRFITMFFCFVLLVVIFVLYGMFGRGVEFFPEVDPRRVYVDVTYAEGTSLEVSNEATRLIEGVLLKKEDIKYVITTVGSQSDAVSAVLLGAGAGNPHLSRVMFEFYDFEDRKRPSVEVIEEVRSELDALQIPGAVIKLGKEEMGPPQDSPVMVEISGDHYDVLGRLAEKVKRAIKDVPGLVDLDDDYESGRPEFRVLIDRQRAARLGLDTRSIAMTIRTALHGTEASTLREGNEEYDITVKLPESHRKSLGDILKLRVYNKDEQLIYLSDVARVVHDAGWGAVSRKNNRRTVSVTANNAEGFNANVLLAEVRERLKTVSFPPGYFLEMTGQKEEQDKNQAFLMKAFALAVMLILLILVSEFNSVTMPVVIMTSVFLSLFGVFAGLLITGTPFGIIMTGIGVISLAGVVVNNAIVLIDYTHQLRDRGMERTEAVIQAGRTRFRPVLLTAITTIAGLIPLTTGYGFDVRRLKWITGSENSQFWSPMGIAVIFGLAFATVLTLVVVPVMYTFVDDFEEGIKCLVHKWFPQKD